MDYDTFTRSIETQDAPDSQLAPALQALWWDRKGDWEKAHNLAQEAGSKDGDWVHAYLHRVEGDLGNASYWYNRAGQPAYEGDTRDEWTAMAKTLLKR